MLVTQLKRQRRGKPSLATFLSLDAGSVSDGCSNFFVLRDQLHAMGLVKLNPPCSPSMRWFRQCSCRGFILSYARRRKSSRGQKFRLPMAIRLSFGERLIIVAFDSTTHVLDLGKKTSTSGLHRSTQEKTIKFEILRRERLRPVSRWQKQALLAACRRTAWAKGPLRGAVPEPCSAIFTRQVLNAAWTPRRRYQ